VVQHRICSTQRELWVGLQLQLYLMHAMRLAWQHAEYKLLSAISSVTLTPWARGSLWLIRLALGGSTRGKATCIQGYTGRRLVGGPQLSQVHSLQWPQG